ncbi:MAG: hypothetical protein JWO70_2839 [Betaproteobacteria bacterium]|jgi:hypothetical protein|nr:hypothetical protein [Betaproteobacteria bacterium]
MKPVHYTRSILICALAALGATSALADAGRVKVSSGPVHIERGGQRIAAPVDTLVQAEDTIVTGANGSVGVTFTDNTRVSAGPNSVLAINRYAFDQATHAGTFDATIKRGTLGVISGKMAKASPEAVTLRTASMVMGVRGTEFVVYAGE